jgi:mono/diheme cytochrome c family protein
MATSLTQLVEAANAPPRSWLPVLAFAAGLLAALPAVEAATDGQSDFMALCADCHGEDARGNGPLTKNLSKVPLDLTRIRQRAGKFDEKAVYDWIIGLKMNNSHGTRDMPIWGDWLMDETLEGGTSLEAARAAEKEIEQRVMAIVKYLEQLQVKN